MIYTSDQLYKIILPMIQSCSPDDEERCATAICELFVDMKQVMADNMRDTVKVQENAEI